MILPKVLQGGGKFFRENPRKEVKKKAISSARCWQKKQKRSPCIPFYRGMDSLIR